VAGILERVSVLRVNTGMTWLGDLVLGDLVTTQARAWMGVPFAPTNTRRLRSDFDGSADWHGSRSHPSRLDGILSPTVTHNMGAAYMLYAQGVDACITANPEVRIFFDPLTREPLG